MMRKYLLFWNLIFFASTAHAQSEEREVMDAVVYLFNSMREADTTAVRAAFVPGALLHTVVEIDGRAARPKSLSLDAFLASVGKQQAGALDERIMFDMVRVDGKLASVWAPYLFNLNGQLSHCGVNAIQLVKTAPGWKIHSIIDTRQKEGCKPSHWFK